jgi:putative FmdB family regulatory protein
MPVYEYRCRQCGHVFAHRFRTLKAAEEGDALPCPVCGIPEVERLVSSVAVLGGESGGRGGETQAPAADSKVFGRKELKKALQDRGY